MGFYNPHAPRIIGQEWVPIRDESLIFSPAVNAVEQGHGFTLTSSRQLVNGRFYINTMPPQQTGGQVYEIAIYPRGRENQTGPISSVIIPCNSAGITGNGISSQPGASAITAAQVPGLLEDSSDGQYVAVTPNTDINSKAINLFFATNSYGNLLNGKRILAVNLIHSFSWQLEQAGVAGSSAPRNLVYTVPQDLSINTGGGTLRGPVYAPVVETYGSNLQGLNPPIGRPPEAIPLSKVRFGEVNHLWQNPSLQITSDKVPWRYTELQRFEQTAGTNRYWVHYEFGGLTEWAGVFYLGYAALEIIYCEEQRVIYGMASFNDVMVTSAFIAPYNLGANIITLRDTALNSSPTLAAGDYTTVVSCPDIGDLQGPTGAAQTRPASANSYPILNAVRQLYSIPTHPGVEVKLPVPLEGHIADRFIDSETQVLPQISLHTSGGPLTEVHVYGRQAAAQVYGTVTATQEIQDNMAGGAATWPWVRYVARRFGDTTVPLTLTGASQSVAITVAEFDALDEVVDGWKEITLRFTTPPTMGAGTIPQFIWSAAAETAGNRWEVLGAIAPAISGVPGNSLNLVPSPNQLSIATYGQPASGAGINLGWIPQYAPHVSATVDDQTSDAFIIFAQDMPTVTNLAVAVTSQPMSGIGQDCGLNPCCVPTSMYYNRLTWTATSSAIPASGFGYYELQRMDTVETDWATIMKSTSPTGASFNDYEARVGIVSSYRIRAVDVYEFPGLWSSTVTATVTAPGVVIGCTGGHLLIFTSNERQDGSINLAYSSVWEGNVEENFAFPEAGFVQLQAMYDRDYFTAFRPSERGGEQFQRTVLVQAAAIAAETLADFTGLRDMAWEDTSYICVRDEDGNRWLATVMVPSGRVLRDRRLYMAPVNIVEVTATPSPVDPYA